MKLFAPVLSLLLLAACGSSTETSSTMGSTGGGGGSSTTSATGGTGGGMNDACAKQATDLQTLLEQNKPKVAPGAILAVSTPACGVWVGATGNATKSEPMKPDDVFRIGSTTKTFVSARVLKLVEAGKVTLDDTLEQWLPGFPGGDGISVRQLMNHTSGIFDFTADTTFQSTVNGNPKMHWDPQALVDVAAKHPPYFAPGADFHYSNTNYILLGMLVEKATGNALGKELRDSLLTPAALTSTSFAGEEPVVGHLAHGFQGDFDVTSVIDPSYAWAAGAMVSSGADLVHWASALYGGEVLAPGTMDALLTTVDTGQPGFGYGLGVFVGDASVALDTIVGHGGDIPGYHTDMWYLPNQKIAFAVVVNADGATPGDVTAAVLQYFLQ
ncbi:D-alanyl-D-alanine carboxypeptidase [Minicystis rosea]|nr:D-alanyl-D-alanine carboxypeptidase [Minicystis rosea]